MTLSGPCHRAYVCAASITPARIELAVQNAEPAWIGSANREVITLQASRAITRLAS